MREVGRRIECKRTANKPTNQPNAWSISKRVKMNVYGYCCGCIYTIHHSLRTFFFIFSDAFRSCVYMNWLCVLMTKNKQIMWWKYDAITMFELHRPEHRDVQCDGLTFIWLQTFKYQYEIFSIVRIAFSTENARKKNRKKNTALNFTFRFMQCLRIENSLPMKYEKKKHCSKHWAYVYFDIWIDFRPNWVHLWAIFAVCSSSDFV